MEPATRNRWRGRHCCSRCCTRVCRDEENFSTRIQPLCLVLVPASPGMLVVLIAVVEIGANEVSPPVARGIVVETAPEPPMSYPSEWPLRISPPSLKACLPLVQLRLSPYVHRTVVSRYEA